MEEHCSACAAEAWCHRHRRNGNKSISHTNSPVAEEPNLAMSGNNRFSAFFRTPYHVVQESAGCTDFPLLAFSKFKMASNTL